jgi:hypothetical protein
MEHKSWFDCPNIDKLLEIVKNEKKEKIKKIEKEHGLENFKYKKEFTNKFGQRLIIAVSDFEVVYEFEDKNGNFDHSHFFIWEEDCQEIINFILDLINTFKKEGLKLVIKEINKNETLYYFENFKRC